MYNTGLLLAGSGAGSAAACCRENVAAMGALTKQPGQEWKLVVMVCKELDKEDSCPAGTNFDEQLWIKLGSAAPQPIPPSAHPDIHFY